MILNTIRAGAAGTNDADDQPLLHPENCSWQLQFPDFLPLYINQDAAEWFCISADLTSDIIPANMKIVHQELTGHLYQSYTLACLTFVSTKLNFQYLFSSGFYFIPLPTGQDH